MEKTERRQIRVYGIVQGVGFRPAVDRHAHALGIRGTVANRGSFVEINAEGVPSVLDEFEKRVKEQPPERAVILKMDVKLLEQSPAAGFGDIAGQSQGSDGFRIVESEKTSGEIFISPDIAICDTCKAELFDKNSRRYLHPFINCTCCGPRFSLLEVLPYDRERTSMKKFPMCPQCRREYFDPKSRFYDAQPVCCNDCGPQVYLIERAGETDRRISVRGAAAISRARQILVQGGIIAVKGIGGFHLACNAADEDAVTRLRRLKRRPMKPFAVMARDEAVCRRECEVSPEQHQILTGHQKPILLLPKKAGGRICSAVAPDIPTIGMMLPYAPIQLLLFTYEDAWQERMPDVLVMTSGNASGAPIASNDAEALDEIAGFCDAILSNNRDIRIRTDDSVMDFYDHAPYMIRRSRGYAPLPFLVSRPYQGQVLGIGGELKNTFCLGKDQIFYPSAYVGDLADLRTVKALEDAVKKTETLLEMKPQVIAADLHPKYNSTLVAEKLAEERGIPLLRVQHHYAHVLSCMAENDYLEPVIGVSFDGTGFGTDGTIWGGEFLLSDIGHFERGGHIAPFWQIGGDTAAREGWRIAVSMLQQIFGAGADDLIRRLGLCDEMAAGALKVLFTRKINAVQSTSAGRLFDAVSAILGIRRASTYEGEAATALMYSAMRGRAHAAGSLASLPGLCRDRDSLAHSRQAVEAGGQPQPDVLPTDSLVRALVLAKLDGAGSEELAYEFHRGLAQMIVRETVSLSERTGVKTAALTGGVFQNRLLLELVEKGLQAEKIQVLRHHLVPPNDGGIALGQALYAMAALGQENGV
ncbi:carbamoyltransferase HypF [Porcincola sp. LCP21S3_C12]|uniref:carbamoyltransferase HypF n=1 Tax=Porcincola sp. LCP21S3_C12 TaxID=3438798 RepID=UPI003F9AE100